MSKTEVVCGKGELILFQGMFLNLQSQLQSLLFTAMGVLPAIVIHEYAHGWISYKLGDPTAKQAGRLTLNPLKHLDPLGVLCMLFFHVGWAKPVPINPCYYKNKKKGIITVSLAGPLANFILAFVMLLAGGLLMKYGAYGFTQFLITRLIQFFRQTSRGMSR